MSGSSRIERVTGRAVVLRGNDVDTDRIIPARFLRAITFEGLERHLFADDRKHAADQGVTHPFDLAAHRAATVLIVNTNFGCGSSREHAPQAIARWGIQAIVGESFGEIFAGNSLAIGLPCLHAAREDVERLMALVEERPSTVIDIDIRNGTLQADDRTIHMTLPAAARDALISGHWNATELLLENYDEVERVAARLRIS